MTNYKFLKLVNGDNIICKTEDDCKSLTGKKMISVTDPVVLNQVRIPRGDMVVESYILFPLFSFSSENVYEIPVAQVVVATNIKESLRKNYDEYLRQQEEADAESEEGIHFAGDVNELEEFEDDEIDEIFDELMENLGDGNDENKERGRVGNTRRILH
jgi:hypothetical protein